MSNSGLPRLCRRQNVVKSGDDGVDFVSDVQRALLSDAIEQPAEDGVDAAVLLDVGGLTLRREADFDAPLVRLRAFAGDIALALQRGEQLVHLALEQMRAGDQVGGGHRPVLMVQQKAEHMCLVIGHRGDEACVPQRRGEAEPCVQQLVAGIEIAIHVSSKQFN